MEWNISDDEILETEKLLLPNGSHFSDDAKQVIRCWESTEVSACPGSGKTTVLLAKLKLLADRMPLERGAGVCVLSHTNVAVNEIKDKLRGCANKLMSYPNYVGTIQSFIDHYVVLPYIRKVYGQSVRPVDDRTYSNYMIRRMTNEKYQTISTLLRSGFNNASDQYNSFVEYVMALYINKEGDLCIGNRRARLAGADTDSAKQYTKLKEALLINDGIIRFDDTFRYAEAAICEYSELYTNLFSLRYQYVFIDEYQDCSNRQRLILSKLFDQSKCVVIMIGDPDQAIYNSNKEDTLDWVPSNSTLSIASACRYNQEIAEILSPLRQDGQSIHSLIGVSGIKPVLIIYNSETIDRVIGAFISLLDKHGLSDPEGIYKIIGYIKNEDAKGLSIQSYWDKYDSSARQNDDTYWSFIDEICTCLQTGRLYKAEAAVRRLICRMFFFCGITNKNNGRRFHTASSIRTALNEKYFDLYSSHILELAKMDCYDRDFIHRGVSALYNDLITTAYSKEQIERLKQMPDFFIKQKACGDKIEANNVFVEPLHKRVIQFDTVHGVKGETHDATLYLETEQSRSSDILRMLYCFGIGKKGKSPLYEYSRKVAYVGMSRPKTLLCVAMRDTTYQKGKNAFKDWDKLFLAQTQGAQEQIDN